MSWTGFLGRNVIAVGLAFFMKFTLAALGGEVPLLNCIAIAMLFVWFSTIAVIMVEDEFGMPEDKDLELRLYVTRRRILEEITQ